MAIVDSRSELLASGRPATRIDNHVRSGRLIRPFQGIYLPGEPDSFTLTTRWRAAVKTQHPASMLGFRSAATAMSIPYADESWAKDDAMIDLLIPVFSNRREQDGLRLRRADPGAAVTIVDGLRMTSPGRTVLDLIRERDVSPWYGVQLLDGLLLNNLTTEGELAELLDSLVGRRGVKRARAAVALARSHVMSPGETSARLTLIDGGVRDEDIDVNIELYENNVLVAAGDLGSEDLLIWCEYDGYDIHRQRPTFGKDRRKDRWLAGRGWDVMRITDDDIKSPGQFLFDYKRAMRDAPARILALSPDRSPEVARAQGKLRARGFHD